MTVLTIVQEAIKNVGLFDEPSTVVGNSSKDVKTALSLLTKAGGALTKYQWNTLQNEQEFNTVADQEAYVISTIIDDDDYSRLMPGTEWDRSNFRKMNQVNPAEWGLLKGGLASTVGITKFIRQRGDSFIINPTPGSIETLVIEYISNKWINAASGGAKQSTFLDDGDTTDFDETLLQMSLEWRLLSRFKLPFGTALKEYEDYLDDTLAGDTPSEDLHFGHDRILVPVANTPDTGVGL